MNTIRGVIFAALAMAIATNAQGAPVDNALRTIIVNGRGQVSGKPDQAQVRVGVTTRAETAEAALEANTQAMSSLFDSLRRLGIPENRIQTSNFTLFPQYLYRPDGTAPSERYMVSNQVTVVLSDISKVGATLDALVKSGANQSYNLVFDFADPKPLARRARADAVADAVDKAKTLADASGLILGPILSVQEGVSYSPVVQTQATYAVAPAPAPAPPPIAGGEASVTVNVTMTYAIQ